MGGLCHRILLKRDCGLGLWKNDGVQKSRVQIFGCGGGRGKAI
jgi:hypothetical protein